jgi:hypothetical protein
MFKPPFSEGTQVLIVEKGYRAKGYRAIDKKKNI